MGGGLQIERDAQGDFILDSAEVAARFSLAVADFRRNMALGHVTSMVEAGDGEDEGTFRLTLRLGNRVWRAIVDGSGNVVGETMSFTSAARATTAPAGRDAPGRGS